MTALQIRDLLARYQLACLNEAQLQQAIEECFRKNDVTYQREFRLPANDRPDFAVPASDFPVWHLGIIAVEVKVDGSISEVTRQLHRYAQYKAVHGILLVTSRSKHIGVAKQLNGKRVVTLWIGGRAGL